jgi:hypothetical protein
VAITTEGADLIVNYEAVPRRMNARERSKGETYFEEFTFVQGVAAGDINSTIRAAVVPAGARVDVMQSWVKWSAFGAARLLSFGYEAHTTLAGVAVPQALTAFTAGLDVSAVGGNFIGLSPTKTLLTRTMEGEAILSFQCTGGTIPAGATLTGKIVWAMP